MKTGILLFSCMLASLQTAPGSESVVYANFTPGDVPSGPMGGWRLGGGAIGGTSGTMVGLLFTPYTTKALSRIEIVADRESGGTTLHGFVMTNNSGPGTIVETLTFSPTSSDPTVLSASSKFFPILNASQQYWFVLAPPDLVNDSFFWFRHASQPFTTIAYRQGVSSAWSVYDAYGAMLRIYGTDNARAQITFPPPGSTLPGTNATFSWSPGNSADSYWLDVGNTAGSGDISAGATSATSRTVGNLPSDGRTLYVRLWTHIAGAWQPPIDYVYRTFSNATWQAIDPAGDAPQFTNLVTASAKVANGEVKFSVRYFPGDFSPTKSALDISLDTDQNPATGHPGIASSGTIDSAVLGADYIVEMGGSNYGSLAYVYKYTGPPINTFTFIGSKTVQFFSDGMDVSIPLSMIGNDDGLLNFKVVSQVDLGGGGYTGIADVMPDAGLLPATSVSAGAEIVAPQAGSVIAGSAVTFTWSAASGASGYWLDVGTAQGQGTIFGQNVGLATSQVVAGIPTNGTTIYVRLWTQSSGVWRFNDYTYTAGGVTKAIMTAPVPGSTLSSAATFIWSAGAGASAYWLDVGTAQGLGNIFGRNVGLVTSQAVTGIPTNGGTIWVRLWTLLGNAWQYNDYTYGAGSNPTKAVLSNPTPGSTLSGSSVTFTWVAGYGASAYWLDVGLVQGQGTIFGANVGLALSRTVNGIPTNGATIYVRLWTLTGGGWQFNDYSYMAAGGATKATMITPVPGSTLSGSTATFTWNAATGASAYWLDVGTALGQGNLFGRNVGLATSQTVTGIPTNGGTVYARLWTLTAGVWQSPLDYTYRAALAMPVRISPADGAVFNIFPRTIVYLWSAVYGATSYGLEIEYCQPGRVQCVTWLNTTTAGTTVTNGFVGMQPGRWRVWAINGATGATSAKTDWWWFDNLQ